MKPHDPAVGEPVGDLRARSVSEITSIPFDGFAIGGVSVGEGFDDMTRVVRFTAPLLPENLPDVRHGTIT